MTIEFRSLGMVGLGAALLVAATPGYTQQASTARTKDAAGDSLEEVLVTASKREERLIDVPSAITAVSAAKIESLGLSGFDDYAGLVPNLTQRSFGAPGSGTMIIRGLNTGPQQTTATAGIYLDDVPVTPSGSLSVGALTLVDADLADVERIEVLKGPQGTLYGASSLGGIVHIVSRKPNLEEFSGNFTAQGSTVQGASSGFGGRGTVNVPVATGRAALRVSGFYRQEPAYVNNLGTGKGDTNESTSYGGRLSFLAALNDAAELRLNVLYQKSGIDALAIQDNVTDTLRPRTREFEYSTYFDGGYESKYQAANATLEWKVGPGALTSTLAYSKFDTQADPDYTPIYGAVLAAVLPMGSGIHGVLGPQSRKVTGEVRYASERIGRFEFLGGLFYTDEHNLYPVSLRGESIATGALLPSVFGNLLTGITDSTYKEKAAFGNATFYLRDDLDFTLGARYARNEEDATSTRSGLLLGILGAPSVRTYAGDDNATTYLGTVRWRLSDDLSTFVRAASSYRPGGPQTNANATNPAGFKPDTVWNYEAGIKASLPERRMTLAASVYQIDWKDIQLNTLQGGFVLLGNGGGARVKGLEFELSAEPTTGLGLGLSLGYNDSEITKIGAAESADTGAVVGDRLPLSSKLNGAATVDYRWPLAATLDASVGGTLKFTGSRPSSYSNSPLNPNVNLPSDTVLDLRAGVDFSRYHVQFRIENATDENAISSYVTNKIFAGQPVPSQVVVARPRTYVLSFGVDF